MFIGRANDDDQRGGESLFLKILINNNNCKTSIAPISVKHSSSEEEQPKSLG